MKRLSLILFFLTIAFGMNAQRYFTRQGKISFYSETPIENIEAHTNKVLCIIDLNKGQVAVDLLIKSFEFKKKLMQEHFNENYMESDKFPKATFKGTFSSPKELQELKEGRYTLPVKGEISIHGVKQPLDKEIELIVEKDQIKAAFELKVKVADHKIKIPNLVIDNIAEVIEVKVDLNLKPYKK